MNADLERVTAARDKLAEVAARHARPKRPAWQVAPATVVGRACDAALTAGWAAYRDWHEAHVGLFGVPIGDDVPFLPAHDTEGGWHAWLAALATLNVAVKVGRGGTASSRWHATMTQPGGELVEAANLITTRSCS